MVYSVLCNPLIDNKLFNDIAFAPDRFVCVLNGRMIRCFTRNMGCFGSLCARFIGSILKIIGLAATALLFISCVVVAIPLSLLRCYSCSSSRLAAAPIILRDQGQGLTGAGGSGLAYQGNNDVGINVTKPVTPGNADYTFSD